jgi:hypothetical protein
MMRGAADGQHLEETKRRRADIELDYLDWMGQKTDKQVEEKHFERFRRAINGRNSSQQHK